MKNWQEAMGSLRTQAVEVHARPLPQRITLLDQMLVRPEIARLDLREKVKFIDTFSRTFVEPGFRFEPVEGDTVPNVSFVPVKIIGGTPELFHFSYKGDSQLVRYYYVRNTRPLVFNRAFANTDLHYVTVWEEKVWEYIEYYMTQFSRFFASAIPTTSLEQSLMMRDWSGETFSLESVKKRLYEEVKHHELTHHVVTFLTGKKKEKISRERNTQEYSTLFAEIAEGPLPWGSFLQSYWKAKQYLLGDRKPHSNGGYHVIKSLARVFTQQYQEITPESIDFFVRNIAQYWKTADLRGAAKLLYADLTGMYPLPLEWVRRGNREVAVELDLSQLEDTRQSHL